jgi:hypothetical protein
MKAPILLVMAACLGFAMTANAQNVQGGVAVDEGFYIGGGVGATDLRVKSPEFDSVSLAETGFKIIGGYRFNPFFSVEAAFFNPGKFSESDDGVNVTLRAHTIQAFAVGRFPIGGPISGFGKAGITHWTADLTGTAEGATGTLTDGSIDFTFAIGIEGQINDQLSAALQAEQTTIDASVDDIPVEWRLRLVSASILYRF